MTATTAPQSEPKPPRRVFCAGQPFLVINGIRHWSVPPPPGFEDGLEDLPRRARR